MCHLVNITARPTSNVNNMADQESSEEIPMDIGNFGVPSLFDKPFSDPEFDDCDNEELLTQVVQLEASLGTAATDPGPPGSPVADDGHQPVTDTDQSIDVVPMDDDYASDQDLVNALEHIAENEENQPNQRFPSLTEDDLQTIETGANSIATKRQTTFGVSLFKRTLMSILINSMQK